MAAVAPPVAVVFDLEDDSSIDLGGDPFAVPWVVAIVTIPPLDGCLPLVSLVDPFENTVETPLPPVCLGRKKSYSKTGLGPPELGAGGLGPPGDTSKTGFGPLRRNIGGTMVILLGVGRGVP